MTSFRYAILFTLIVGYGEQMKWISAIASVAFLVNMLFTGSED